MKTQCLKKDTVFFNNNSYNLPLFKRIWCYTTHIAKSSRRFNNIKSGEYIIPTNWINTTASSIRDTIRFVAEVDSIFILPILTSGDTVKFNSAGFPSSHLQYNQGGIGRLFLDVYAGSFIAGITYNLSGTVYRAAIGFIPITAPWITKTLLVQHHLI